MIFVAFKAIGPVLRGQDGGFDSHTLPPISFVLPAEDVDDVLHDTNVSAPFAVATVCVLPYIVVEANINDCRLVAEGTYWDLCAHAADSNTLLIGDCDIVPA